MMQRSAMSNLNLSLPHVSMNILLLCDILITVHTLLQQVLSNSEVFHILLLFTLHNKPLLLPQPDLLPPHDAYTLTQSSGQWMVLSS